MTSIAHHLLGQTRASVLSALLLHPEASLHVRELARMTEASPGSLHRELRTLAELGLLLRREVGRQVHYQANTQHPLFPELSGLLRKTLGLVDVVRAALQPVSDRVVAAFIYGSMASGAAGPQSDVDVMILGDLAFADAVRALAPAQEALRREVNATVMKSVDFANRRKARDGFVSGVWRSPKLWIIGSEHEPG